MRLSPPRSNPRLSRSKSSREGFAALGKLAFFVLVTSLVIFQVSLSMRWMNYSSDTEHANLDEPTFNAGISFGKAHVRLQAGISKDGSPPQPADNSLPKQEIPLPGKGTEPEPLTKPLPATVMEPPKVKEAKNQQPETEKAEELSEPEESKQKEPKKEEQEQDEQKPEEPILEAPKQEQPQPNPPKQKKRKQVHREYSDFITSKEIGWGNKTAQEWMLNICPEVVEHFNKFPSFAENHVYYGTPLPLQTTDFAVRTVCTFKVVQMMAASINTRLYLHAGSHLGAVLHGQPIAWDDDADAFMDFYKRDAFLAICKDGFDVYPGVTAICSKQHNALKVWLKIEGMVKETKAKKAWWSPYVDLFLYKKENDEIFEVAPNGKRAEQYYSFQEYFPTVPYYFGGLVVFGPQPTLAENRYSFDVCVTAHFNHRIDTRLLDWPKGWRPFIDCKDLGMKFPFRTAYNELTVGNSTHKIFGIPDYGASNPKPLTITSRQQRDEWANISDTSQGQSLTNSLPNLDAVEVDNTLAPNEECSGKNLKVVEYNAERGRWWKEAADIMKDYDVIILNEMDIGMARSDQQHTTRQMAQYLRMNYAWGLEFVELTLGDQNDREATTSHDYNYFGLHGNAILSKCKISDPIIVRGSIGKFFSNEANSVNAGGLEKRLGGRMALLGRIIVDGSPVVIGSIHKFSGSKKQIIDYIGTSSAVIAGDQQGIFCENVGLSKILSDGKHGTWPATCSTTGERRGDNICSNMEIIEPEDVILPCVKRFGFELLLSDHAFTWTTLAHTEAKAKVS